MASRALGTLTLDLVAKIGGFTQSMDRAAQVVDSRMKSIQDSANRAKKALTGIFAVAIGGLTIKSLADMADSYGQMANRIRMATVSTEEYNQVQQRLLQTANITYRPLEEAQELYIRTADSIKSLGYNTDAALDITDSFSYLLVTNATAADKAKTSISALSKAIQTGKVDSQSWQSILMATPTIVDSIAQAAGKTNAEIRELGIQGKLSLNELLEGLRKNVEANKQLAEGMDTTINDAFVRLRNNIKAFVGEQNSAYGVTAAFAQIIGTLANNVELLAAGAFVLLAGKAGAMAASMAGATIAMVNNTKATIQNAFAEREAAAAKIQSLTATVRQSQALAMQAQQLTLNARLREMETRGTIQHTAALNALATARRNEVAANLRSVEATKALNFAQSATLGTGRALLGILGGPVGIGLTVASVAAGWLLYKSNAEQANQVNIDLTQSTEELTNKLKEMSQNQLILAVDDLKKQKNDVLREFDSIYGELREIARKNSPGSQFRLDTLMNEFRAGERDISSLTDTFFQYVRLDEKAQLQFRQTAEALDKNNQQYLKTNNTLVDAQQRLDNVSNSAVVTKQAMQDIFALSPEQTKGVQNLLDGINNRILQLRDNTGMLSLQKSLNDLKIPEGSDKWNEAINAQKELISLQSKRSETKSSVKTENDIAKAYQSQVTQLNQQIALFGQTSNEAKTKYELANGELKVLGDTEKQLLTNKAVELDQLNTRKEFDSLMKELRTDEEKVRDTLAERVKLLKDANIQGKEYADAMARIGKASIGEAPKFGGIDASVGGASGELLKVGEAQKELDKWREQELARQKEYLDNKEILEENYAANVAEINKRTAESQQRLNESWRTATLATFASVTGDAASMLKELGGESSILYKTMFAVSKAASIALAIINTEEAATKALAIDPTGVLSNVTRGLGYASVGMIAAQSIAGMAHDGLDYIPKEGTWLLDKGERVLSPRQNNDLTNYLNNAANSPNYSNAPPQVNITVYQDGSGQTESTQGYEQFAQQSFEAIKQIARSTIMQEQRKGGLLDPNNRRVA